MNKLKLILKSKKFNHNFLLLTFGAFLTNKQKKINQLKCDVFNFAKNIE